MRMDRAVPIFAALIVVVLASCQRSEAPPSESPLHESADEKRRSAACRQWASAQAEREFSRVQTDADVAFGRSIALRDRFDRFDADKRRETLYQRCMTEEMPQGRP